MDAHWSTTLNNLATSAAIFVGGGWTFWKFVINRERYAKPEFTVDMAILGQSEADKKYLVELSALVKNKSTVRLIIPKFTFSLFCLKSTDTFTEGEENINSMIRFNPLIKERLWLSHLKNGNDYTFVDAGTEQRYSYVTSLPYETAFILLQSKFEYTERDSEWHSAQKCVPVRGQ